MGMLDRLKKLAKQGDAATRAKRAAEQKRQQAEEQRRAEARERDRKAVEEANRKATQRAVEQEQHVERKREKTARRAMNWEGSIRITKREPYPYDPFVGARQVSVTAIRRKVGFELDRMIRLNQAAIDWLKETHATSVTLRVVARHGGVLTVEKSVDELADALAKRHAKAA